MTELRDIVTPVTDKRGAAVVLKVGIATSSDDLIEVFTPTQSATEILRHLQKAVLRNAPKEARAMVWHGVYGSGKSHLGVLVGHLLAKGSGSPAIQRFLERLGIQGENVLRREIESTFHPNDDPDARPYLLVPLYGSPAATLQNALLEGLHDALLHTDGLDPATIMPKTEYAAAQERLATILEHYPDYRQKPLADWGIKCDAFNPEELGDQLHNVLPEALDTFKKWHPKVSAGAHFDPQKFGGKNVIATYQEAAKGLAERGYNGIAVLWDEFGYALENMISDPDRKPIEEIFELQHFVEAVCEPPQAHTLFITLTHRSLREYGISAGAQEDIKQRLETIEGRFRQLSVELKGSEAEGYHLLAARIKATPYGISWLGEARSKAQELAGVCTKLPLFEKLASDLDFIITHCYPLHPVTAAGLFAIASHGVYAQASRTVFTFFDNLDVATEGRAFERQVDTEHPLTIELMRLPELLRVYEKEIFDEYPGLADSYRDAVAKVKAGFSHQESKVAILGVLLLARVLGEGFQPTDDFLAVALHDQDKEPDRLREDLEALHKAGLIWRRDADTPVWELEGEAGTQISEVIDEELAQIPVQTITEMLGADGELRDDLLPQCGIHDLEPSQAGIIRSYEVGLLADLDDSEALSLSNERLSAQVWFLLPDTDTQAAAALQRCPRLPAPGYLCYVWIPSRGLADLAPRLRRYKAIGNLLKKTGASDAIRRRLGNEAERERKVLRNVLNTRLGRDALKSADVSIQCIGDPKQQIIVKSWHSFTDYLFDQVQALYPHEVMVRTMNANRLYSSEDRKITRIETLLGRILEFDDLSPSNRNDLLGEKDSSEVAALIDGTLGVYTNGLLVERANGWALKTPDEAEGSVGELLHLIRSSLTDKRKKVYDIGELRSRLLRPPWGIPVTAMPVFTAVAIRKEASHLKWVNKTGKFAHLLWTAFANYDGHKLRFDTFKPRQLKVLEAIAQVLQVALEPSAEADDQARETVKALRDYAAKLPGAIKSSTTLPDDMRSLFTLLQQPGHDAQEIADRLLEIVAATAPDQQQSLLQEKFDLVERIKDERSALIRQVVARYAQPPERWQRIETRLKQEGKEALAVTCNNLVAGEPGHLDAIASCFGHQSFAACSDIDIGTLVRDIETALDDADRTDPAKPDLESASKTGATGTAGDAPVSPQPATTGATADKEDPDNDPEQAFENELHRLLAHHRARLPSKRLREIANSLVAAMTSSTSSH